MSCRFRSPIGVGELMHYFDAMHTSVNSPPAKGNEQQDTATQNKKVKTETQVLVAAVSDPNVTQLVHQRLPCNNAPAVLATAFTSA